MGKIVNIQGWKYDRDVRNRIIATISEMPTDIYDEFLDFHDGKVKEMSPMTRVYVVTRKLVTPEGVIPDEVNKALHEFRYGKKPAWN